jgi:hypothetical protein
MVSFIFNSTCFNSTGETEQIIIEIILIFLIDKYSFAQKINEAGKGIFW